MNLWGRSARTSTKSNFCTWPIVAVSTALINVCSRSVSCLRVASQKSSLTAMISIWLLISACESYKSQTLWEPVLKPWESCWLYLTMKASWSTTGTALTITTNALKTRLCRRIPQHPTQWKKDRRSRTSTTNWWRFALEIQLVELRSCKIN